MDGRYQKGTARVSVGEESSFWILCSYSSSCKSQMAHWWWRYALLKLFCDSNPLISLLDHFNAVAEAILSARSEIYIADWWLSPELVCVCKVRLFMSIDVSSMFSIFDDLLQKMKISELIDYSNAKLRKVSWFTLSCTKKLRLLWRLIQLIPRNGFKRCIPISWVSKQQAIYLVIDANIPF